MSTIHRTIIAVALVALLMPTSQAQSVGTPVEITDELRASLDLAVVAGVLSQDLVNDILDLADGDAEASRSEVFAKFLAAMHAASSRAGDDEAQTDGPTFGETSAPTCERQCFEAYEECLKVCYKTYVECKNATNGVMSISIPDLCDYWYDVCNAACKDEYARCLQVCRTVPTRMAQLVRSLTN